MAEYPQNLLLSTKHFKWDHDSWHRCDASQNSKVCGASSKLKFKITAMARFYRGKDTADLVKGRSEGKDVSNIWICIIFGWISWKFWMSWGSLHSCSPIGVSHDSTVTSTESCWVLFLDGTADIKPFPFVGLLLYTVERWMPWSLHQQVDFLLLSAKLKKIRHRWICVYFGLWCVC